MRDLERLARQTLDALATDPLGGDLRVGVYGAGLVGRWSVEWLRRQGADVVACFDRDQTKHHSRIDGVDIFPPDAIGTHALDLIFVATRHAVHDVSRALAAYAIPTISIDAFCAARFLDAFRSVRDEALADERSRATLDAILEAMLTGRPKPCERVWERDQYFCLPAFCGKEREVYVDAGAYVGDSVERFLWAQNGVFEAIYAFEPGPAQFAALQARMDRLCREWAIEAGRVELIQAGLSDRAAVFAMQSSNDQLQSVALGGAGNATGRTLRLDDVLAGRRISLLKADIEGMEAALLDGAAGAIRQWSPKLAICAYHYPLDIVSLVAKIRALNPAYTFVLRHHAPCLLETVLYATVD